MRFLTIKYVAFTLRDRVLREHGGRSNKFYLEKLSRAYWRRRHLSPSPVRRVHGAEKGKGRQEGAGCFQERGKARLRLEGRTQGRGRETQTE